LRCNSQKSKAQRRLFFVFTCSFGQQQSFFGSSHTHPSIRAARTHTHIHAQINQTDRRQEKSCRLLFFICVCVHGRPWPCGVRGERRSVAISHSADFIASRLGVRAFFSFRSRICCVCNPMGLHFHQLSEGSLPHTHTLLA